MLVVSQRRHHIYPVPDLVITIATGFATFADQVGEVDGVDTEQRHRGRLRAW
jgi:hypothetical protein